MLARMKRWAAVLVVAASGALVPGFASCQVTDNGFVAFYDDDLFNCDEDDDNGSLSGLFDELDELLDDLFDDD